MHIRATAAVAVLRRSGQAWSIDQEHRSKERGQEKEERRATKSLALGIVKHV